MYRLDTFVVAGIAFLFIHIQTVASSEEICSTDNNVIKFCDGETSYCCDDGNACCPYWHTEIKYILLGFLCLCAAALVIPVTCTICAYCVFNVILQERNTAPKSEDAESPGQEETTTNRKFPIGYQSEEKSVPEVFISPDEFILDLQSKNSDKKYLIIES